MTSIPLSRKPFLTTEMAKAIMDAAAAEAAAQKLNMAIAIVDDGGHLMHFQRLSDQVPLASTEIAITKARSAALFRRPTLAWEEASKERPLVLAVPQVLALGGGVPLMTEGLTIGAIGVSGSTSVDDDRIAKAGAKLMD